MGNTLSKAVILGISVLILSSCGAHEARPEPSPAPYSPAVTAGPKEQLPDTAAEEQELRNFINAKLMGPQGVYTNLLESAQSAEQATGHEILSESASLLMETAVLDGDQALFDRQWALAREVFDMDSGFSYRFSPKQQKQYPVNAAVDDLRLISALYEAGQAFNQQQYTEAAAKYGQRFYANNVKDGYMYDFYDNIFKTTNGFITLCYIDLSALRNLSIDSESGGILLHNMGGILEDGYLSDAFPFYETRFDYESGQYSSEHINTVESLLTILHLAEDRHQKQASIRYLKKQVQAGTLYGQYTRDGQPASDIRSTAIYALTAMIGAVLGDEALYRDSIGRMNEFRVTDAVSPLYGGFGDAASGQAYSFDNLMALAAYSYKTRLQE
ncbi:glycosyl hydrolase family 8 [Paenibacillus sp. MMS20-IR301]|uniref:glycosyl hydrolase family 8 n=1 Tax=Paenibacillus sp. MMS20-IR301 TaxID=2895946 RepID=UPI0028EAE8FB|nr:glycosyl hydrolase family 8 [Paenibacillus sp. MMS20-IR301]WNS42447.1 glycosyl hydrolase family 8 [Paenibacillus sp. MMS20-IR301]